MTDRERLHKLEVAVAEALSAWWIYPPIINGFKAIRILKKVQRELCPGIEK